MKFISNSGIASIRSGLLSDLEKFEDLVFETPLLVLYTKGGSIPHLTKDVFKMVTKEPHILLVPLCSTIRMVEAIKDTSSCYSDFVSMKEYPIFMTIQDPAQELRKGYNTKTTISVWSQNGRHSLDLDKYMDILEICKPDIFHVLCDGDTDESSSAKRVTNSVQHSNRMLTKCLEKCESSNVLQSKGVLGVIEGGYSKDERKRSIDFVKDKSVQGYVIDGLHKNGPRVESISTKDVSDVLKFCLNSLPTEKLRVCWGSWNPGTVLDLIEMGIDVFDSSYSYLATEKYEALTFLFNDCDVPRPSIILKDPQYKDDFEPISKSCECLTCKNHSRAYIQHLHETKELLGFVLLMIHNTHHYIEFFKSIRRNIRDETFPQFRKRIQSQFSSTN